jgi:hypothetical protein
MPLVASTPTANAAVIMVFFLATGIGRCRDILFLRTLVGPIVAAMMLSHTDNQAR